MTTKPINSQKKIIILNVFDDKYEEEITIALDGELRKGMGDLGINIKSQLTGDEK